jgi:hypothetical protein
VRNRYSLKLRTAYRAAGATVRPSAWKRVVVSRVRLARKNAVRLQGVLGTGATGLEPATSGVTRPTCCLILRRESRATRARR